MTYTPIETDAFIIGGLRESSAAHFFNSVRLSVVVAKFFLCRVIYHMTIAG